MAILVTSVQWRSRNGKSADTELSTRPSQNQTAESGHSPFGRLDPLIFLGGCQYFMPLLRMFICMGSAATDEAGAASVLRDDLLVGNQRLVDANHVAGAVLVELDQVIVVFH